MKRLEGITIGVPRETLTSETRVAVVPDTVRTFIDDGARVVVQASAGERSFFSDEEYESEGARVVPDAAGVYAASELILKVKEPVFIEAGRRHEAELLTPGSTVICLFNPAHALNHAVVRTMARRGISCFSLDGLPRLSYTQSMDALTSMSSIAGQRAVIDAAYHLKRVIPTTVADFGSLPAAKVLVVGTGVAGLQALATARRLGATLASLDIRSEANEYASSLGSEIVPFDVPAELAVGEGGYAKVLPDDWYRAEIDVLAPVVEDSDIVVLTVMVPGHEPPVLVNHTTVERMRPGSVIVDVVAGNCALSRRGEVANHGGVTISAVHNIPSMVPVTSSLLLAHNVLRFVMHLGVSGLRAPDLTDPVVGGTLVTHAGRIVDVPTLRAMNEAGC